MKPFDLEAAKRGEPIVTRDRRPAKFVAYEPELKAQKVLAVVDGHISVFTEKGGYFNDNETSVYDLFMAPPPMRSINGHEYPEPVREPLAMGQEFFIANPSSECLFVRSAWVDAPLEFIWLKRGLIHLTSEAAEAHARAIILAGGGEV